FEGPGSIADWADLNGVLPQSVPMYEGGILPRASDVDLVVVMGGSMGANDVENFPWLVPEREFLAEVIELRKPVLGICLGAQLIASALGAAVTPNREREIGWYPVELEHHGAAFDLFPGAPAVHTVLHWHGDTFALPERAVRIARSKACDNQGFLYRDHVLALQYHLETTAESLASMVDNSSDYLAPGTYVSGRKELLDGFERHGSTNRQIMFGVLDALAAR
ncbi:MAG TPA: type 1 glutamine amidotransferase, partial [Spirochaetia bacterium]|nr:type 1 glutamine amidotransferase [Spirochaetia bacterium]